jgi:hypothetical protein
MPIKEHIYPYITMAIQIMQADFLVAGVKMKDYFAKVSPVGDWFSFQIDI